ncbi:MAG: hypothetical protein ACLQPD_28650 [Desulfomonilaceae bacterium]
MAWEMYHRSSRPNPKSPTITLGKTGIIGLNTAVVRILGDRRHGLLMFDKEKGLIGIRILRKAEPDAYPIGVIAQKSHATMSGVAFMKTYGIELMETRAFPATYDEKSGTLVADISEFVKGKK